MHFISAEDVVEQGIAELETASDYQGSSLKVADAARSYPEYLLSYKATEEQEKPELAIEGQVVEEVLSEDTIDAIILNKRMNDAGFGEGSGKYITPEIKEIWSLYTMNGLNHVWNMVKYALSFG